MQTYKFDLKSEKETRDLGKELARALNNTPALIFLRGELGAGKTTLTQGFIGSLVKDLELIQSPTYSYMQSYNHLTSIYHLDLYRIEEPIAVEELGLDIHIDDNTAIRLIEWPERMGHFIRKPDIEICLVKCGDKRRAMINYFSPTLMHA